MPEKTGKAAGKRAAAPRRRSTRIRQVEHAEIAQRAYYIYLDEGRQDALENWLQAERELAGA